MKKLVALVAALMLSACGNLTGPSTADQVQAAKAKKLLEANAGTSNIAGRLAAN